MKKSLILSSIMAIVLVIALSTATFAWYGASNAVHATMTTMQASTGTGNLQISKNETSGWTSTINFTVDATTTKYVPATPKLANNAVITNAFLGNASNWVIGQENADGTVDLQNATGNFKNNYTFYLKNAGQESVNVSFATPTFTVPSGNTLEASSRLVDDCAWVVIVTRNVTNAETNEEEAQESVFHSAYTATNFAGLNGANNNVNQEATGLKAVRTATATNELVITGLKSEETVTVTVYNWIDGWNASSKAGEDSQNGSVNFNIDFTIVE